MSALCTVVALLNLALAGCQPAPKPQPHYFLGRPYQSGGVWWYPRESHSLDETGLAAVYADGHATLTSDGELFSQNVLAVAHATLQLPAIARLTNLETGRAMLVRINDRGTASPHRLVQVTKRVAILLGMPAGGVAQVRLTVLVAESVAAEDRVGGGPTLPIAAAPVGAVAAADLPPPGARPGAGAAVAAPGPPAPHAAEAPLTLPETVMQDVPRPGRLWVRLDSFQSYQYAAMERAKLGTLAPRVERVFDNQSEGFRVIIGPLDSVAQADTVVDQAVRAGVNDARIVVE